MSSGSDGTSVDPGNLPLTSSPDFFARSVGLFRKKLQADVEDLCLSHTSLVKLFFCEEARLSPSINKSLPSILLEGRGTKKRALAQNKLWHNR